MNIKKRIKNKKRFIIVLLSLTLLLVIGTTFALFTDVILLTEQEFTSGTLDIVENDKDPIVLSLPAGMSEGDPIAPGDIFGFTGTIMNEGNLDAKIRVRIEETDEAGDPVTASGDWRFVVPGAFPGVLVAGGNLSLEGVQLEYLRTNVNDVQDTTYYFVLRVEAMQDRNTSDIETDNWDQVVTEPFTLTP